MIVEVRRIGNEYYAQAPDGWLFIDLAGNTSEDIQLIETPEKPDERKH